MQIEWGGVGMMGWEGKGTSLGREDKKGRCPYLVLVTSLGREDKKGRCPTSSLTRVLLFPLPAADRVGRSGNDGWEGKRTSLGREDK